MHTAIFGKTGLKVSRLGFGTMRLPIAEGPELAGRRDDLDTAAELVAYGIDHGITYVDYTTVLAGPDGRIRPEFSGDTVHPNAAGYEVMEKLLLESL